jgi:N,N'-diacetyllegionaminate synthase
MNELKKRFQYPVGFSDHTIGNDCALAAVALGACLIEKHVTLDKELPGPDHKSSSTIEEFADLVKSIRNIEIAMGSSRINISEQEREIARAVRKSIVSIRALKPGETIKETDICFKRPGTGFLPIEKDMIIGKRLKVKVGKDRVITRNMIEWQ